MFFDQQNLTLPGNLRYQPESLKPFFGYDNLYRGVARIELANIDTLFEIGVMPKSDYDHLNLDIRQALLQIPTSEVDEVERQVTKHDIRAWVRIAQQITGPELGRWIHVPLTSYDALDSGRILNYVEAHQKAVHPQIVKVIHSLANAAEKYKDTVQIGRTHGQAALPITVGFWLSTILNRLIENLVHLDEHSDRLVGKISGAVGAYNAQIALGFGPDFERQVLQKVGLDPARVSTQILPPEPLASYLHACVMMSAALGQFGLDGRNLMRSEISEVLESFEAGQVGSSTMAHKRNPMTFENIQGFYSKNLAEYVKVLLTLNSEHQRDLTGSAVTRDFPVIVVNTTYQTETMLRQNKEGVSFIDRISVDADRCKSNFDKVKGVITAEPAYIALQMAGYEGDAHEVVNRDVMRIVKEEKMDIPTALHCLARSEPFSKLNEAYDRVPKEVTDLLLNPERYIGLAIEKVEEVVSIARTIS